MGKADRQLGWAFFWLASGVCAVIALVSAPALPQWSIWLLAGFAGISFFLSAYSFRWFSGPIRVASIVIIVGGSLVWLVSRIQVSKESTEPIDRANLHVVGERFITAEPRADFIKSLEEMPPENAFLVQSVIPRPEAFIVIRNVGKYRVLHYVVRTAIILSPPLGPGDEDQLFAQRSEWQTGGDVGMGNIWYIGKEFDKTIHTRWEQRFQPQDWPDLIAGKKVFYVVTQSTFVDFQGGLPPTESCVVWSLKDHKQIKGLCFGHNT
jgi:hypothetical protein